MHQVLPTTMSSSTRTFLLRIAVAASAASAAAVVVCAATDHLVGNSLWSIPPSDDSYAIWSNNRTFLVGDSLVFRFETGISEVTQVSRREFQSCTAENPFKRILIGPARIPLDEEGMHYYICSFGNYCRLGQKLAVPAQRPRRRLQT